MMRFIVECHKADQHSGLERRDLITIDADVPQVEALLRKGGPGEVGFESWRLLGAEILDAPEHDAMEKVK